MSTRRSARAAAVAPKRIIAASPSDDEADEAASASSSAASMSSEGDATEDEWQPERRGKGKRQMSSDSEEDEEAGKELGESKPEAAKAQQSAKGKRLRRGKSSARPARASTSASADLDGDDVDYDDEMDKEMEREVMTKQAADAWAQVRAKKKAKQTGEPTSNGENAEPSSSSSAASAAAMPSAAVASSSRPSTGGKSKSLNSWLGLPSLPNPTSPISARVMDRDSLFIGFVYPVTSSSPAALARILDHLSNEVHPSLPSNIFPTAFSHLDPRRRGSSHDVQAWRCLALKRGRDGLGGPNDYGLEEGSDDDGERWGGDRVLKAMREVGAVDLLVVVSRWYGGTNLGPVRFDHMRTCAREALKAHMDEEALGPLREELSGLDGEIARLRGQGAATAASYADLDDLDKAQRLVTAKKKTVELLAKRKAAASAPTKPVSPQASHDEALSSQGPDQAVITPQKATATREGPEKSDAHDTSEVAHAAHEGRDGGDVGGQDVLAGWDDLA